RVPRLSALPLRRRRRQSAPRPRLRPAPRHPRHHSGLPRRPQRRAQPPGAAARADDPLQREAIAMSKVLGDDPFAPPAAPTDSATATDAATATDLAPDLAPDSVPPDEAIDDIFYGEETSPPPDEYGPSLDARKEIPYTRSI